MEKPQGMPGILLAGGEYMGQGMLVKFDGDWGADARGDHL
jgi:hypothetical protein